MNAREEEITARMLLEKQERIDEFIVQKRWGEIAALLRFLKRDIPHEMAMTDPALYRRLREQITRFYLRGGGCISLEKVESLCGGS